MTLPVAEQGVEAFLRDLREATNRVVSSKWGAFVDGKKFGEGV